MDATDPSNPFALVCNVHPLRGQQPDQVSGTLRVSHSSYHFFDHLFALQAFLSIEFSTSSFIHLPAHALQKAR